MNERPGWEQMLRDHFAATDHATSPAEIRAVTHHLATELAAQGLPPPAIEAIQHAFMAHAAAVAAAHAQNEELRAQLNQLHATAARKLGRVTCVRHEEIDGEPIVRIWIDDSLSLVLPCEAEPPLVGQTVEYALGTDDDAVFFGASEFGFYHAGLTSARLKRVEAAPDGSTLVEVLLRETGDLHETVVAVASDQLREVLDQLSPGAPVRVTEGRTRIAYPAPPEEQEDEADHPLFTPIEPVDEANDRFVYDPRVVEEFDQVFKIMREPERAREFGIEEIPALICLEGPTGVGKTTMAERLLARRLRELGFQTLSVNTEEMTSFWFGQTEKLFVRALSVGSQEHTLIVIDEIDSVLSKRAGHSYSSTGDVNSRSFSSFVKALKRPNVLGRPLRLVVVTTNFHERLDPAIRSRIDQTIRVGLPTREVVTQIAVSYLGRIRLEETPESIAEPALSLVDFPLVRAVLEGSDQERVYSGCEVLTGRAIEKAVAAVARNAFFHDTPITPFTLARELKRQLHANLANLGREDMGVALGLSHQEAQRVTGVYVNQEALLERAQPTEREMRIRFRLVS